MARLGGGKLIASVLQGVASVAEMQRFVLKVLTGPNAGAEAVLGERTVVGSAETDDIMIGDAVLAPGHFTIETKAAAISLVVGDAPVTIKTETKGKGTYALAPFDLIKFGSTCCAIGPEGAVWPAFNPSDLLPPLPPAAAPEPEAPEPAATPSPSEPVAEPQAKTPSGAFGRPRMAVMAGVIAVLIVLGLGGYFWVERDVIAAVSEASITTAQGIAAGQGAKGVTIRSDGKDGLLAEGFVPTSEQQRRLRQALQEAGLAVKYRVVSLEQQVSAARTIAATAGARVAVEADPETGKLILDGFLPEASHLDALVRSLRRDIADLRPLDARIVTPDTVRSEVVEKLRAAGLEGSTTVELAGDVVRVKGSLPPDGRKTAAEVVQNLNDRWKGMVKVEDATTAMGVSAGPAASPVAVIVNASPPPAKFIIIVGGKEGFVRDEAGRRYMVGDKLVNGEIIEEIGVEEVVTSHGGVKHRYTFGRGQ